MIKRLILLVTILLSGYQLAMPQTIPANLDESAKISILTSAPWAKQVYAVFGHSAIRVTNPSTGLDWVFNYGVFDFNSSNFAYRFMAGETDYMVVPTDFERYVKEYQARGINVYEQTLNLTSTETNEIWQYLITNASPENRVYRYNIFYNNCTTKLTSIIEEKIDGVITYLVDNERKTFRNLIHECVYEQPWLQFSIDLVIGSNADKTITAKEKMFLPIYQMKKFDKSTIKDNNGFTRQLVSTNEAIIKARDDSNSAPDHSPFSPMVVGIILLLLSVGVTIYDYKKKRVVGTIYDTLLFLVAGIGGCIVFFMVFFSVHPCTENNWNLVWLNPVQLLVGLLFFVKPLAKGIYYYHFINFVVLILFLLAWCLIPQQLETAFVPYILAIAMRSGANVCRQKIFKQ